MNLPTPAKERIKINKEFVDFIEQESCSSSLVIEDEYNSVIEEDIHVLSS